ncbi:MAG: serine--tRNA ligase [Nitrospinae bacterium]|nr:serine--tRNA ligase [Nitrospinota bacterium]
MLDIRLIRDETAVVEAGLARRGGADYGIGAILALDGERRAILKSNEELLRQRNEMSKQIGALKKSGQDTTLQQAEVRRMGDEIKENEAKLGIIESDIRQKLLVIPNIPHVKTPEGRSEEDNPEIRRWGSMPEFPFTPKSHVELGESLNILDFPRAAKLSGARFALYRGMGARLERALINFMLDLHTGEHGYSEILPPFMVTGETMTGTGQLPKFVDDLFKLEGRDLWLIPTAEVPVTNIYAGEILENESLPVKMVAYTPCFRSEAGSYGKDTTGLIRQHQFNKVELVKIVRPEESDDELEKLTANAEEVLKRLNLPYRVVALCSGDLGFASARTYDIEVWIPSQGKYREISSCSTFTDFQARRMNLKFRRDKKEKAEFCHTLNGSGLAVGRTVVAIMENYQRADGSIEIPPALRPYMGGLDSITASRP